jgi:hypothetical protein
MIKFLRYCFFLLFFFCCTNAFGQDILIKRSGDTLKTKILEIGIDEIKFRHFHFQNGPIIVISKNEVKTIIYENGSTLTIIPDPYDVTPEINIRNKSHSIKADFFAPLLNHITLGYEYALKPGINLEFKVGVIGPGVRENEDNASGILFKGGIKFQKGSDFYEKGMKYTHPLKGGYIKPEFMFSQFNRNSGSSNDKDWYTNYAINIVFGKQFILGNLLTLDYFAGFGYGWQKSNFKSFYYYDDDFELYDYSHMYLGEKFPLTLSAGMTIGYIF